MTLSTSVGSRRGHAYRGPGRSTRFKILGALIGVSVLSVLTTDSNGTNRIGRALWTMSRALKEGDYHGYWEDLYPSGKDYFAPGGGTPLPGGQLNVGYVLSVPSCPEDANTDLTCHTDPEHAFFDAAAILKHSIDVAHESSKYAATMHAVVHPEAIECMGPNGEPYDRVKVLEDLGYWVLIWGTPMGKSDITDRYLRENIQNDVGMNDLIRLNAFRLDNHPIVVMVDYNTFMNWVPDQTYDGFLASGAKVMFPKSYATDPTGRHNGVNTGFVMIQPDPKEYAALQETFLTTPYDSTTGWAGEGVSNFCGSMGTSGLLAHHFNNEDAIELDRCNLGNENDDPNCGEITTIDEVDVATMTKVCGEPWNCIYDAEKLGMSSMCRTFFISWFTRRQQFEQNFLKDAGPALVPSGTYHRDVFMGYCSEEGPVGYNRMLPDKSGPDACSTMRKTTVSSTHTITYNGRKQKQELALTTGEYTGNHEVCVDGFIRSRDFQPPFNIAFVIDVSGSSVSKFSGTVGDVNKDGKTNTILDAELNAVYRTVQMLIQTPGLDNSNLDIGIIKFSTDAELCGSFPAADPNDPTKVNPQLIAKLTGMRSRGWTNFDDALDKVVDYFETLAPSPKKRTNLLYFLSDGIPNVPGDGDGENTGGAKVNNQPTAVKFDSELKKLNKFDVKRMAIGVGTGSDVSDGSGLDKIDNTPDLITGKGPKLVTTAESLVEELLKNPVRGRVLDFRVAVNDVVQTGIDFKVEPGPLGFTFGTFVVNGLNPNPGTKNRVTATATIGVDGDKNSTGDQVTLTTTSIVKGMM